MGRAPCCDKNGLKKGPWTPEEDQKLIDYIHKHGYGNWRTLPKNAGLQRCGKSCRLRWTNYLRPDIKRGRFSFEEEETIVQLHSILGNKWSAIAARLPGRTDNEIKNYWNTHIRKRLLRMGIDPVTHNPRLDLLDLSSILNTQLFYNPSHNHQFNISRLLGLQQPLLNPELLRLATSLFSSQRQSLTPTPTSNFGVQNQENIQMCNNNPQAQNQMSQLLAQSDQIQTQSLQNIPNCDQLFQSNLTTNFATLENCQENEWQQNLTSNDYFPLDNYGYYEPQPIMDHPPPSDASTFQSNDSNNYLGFRPMLSDLSTPSSSPTPLNSNSTYINSCSTTTHEDDRDISYTSNVLNNFDYSSILEVNNNEFM